MTIHLRDGLRVRTDYWTKPIPTNKYDWSAIDDDTYDGAPDSHCPIGHGTTEDGAIADLLAQIAERDAPPYAPGNRVLHRKDPRDSWIVERCERNARGTWMVRIGVGNVTGSTPANSLLLAPDGWEDAPAMPSGSAQSGLSEDARQAKLDHDAGDPLYLADMRLWHRQRIAWADRWLRLVSGAGAAAAEDAIAFHRGQLDEMTCSDRRAA